MTNTNKNPPNLNLRLKIAAGWPGESLACEWALLDPSGRIQQSGESEPAHWPQAEHCEVVLSGPQCVQHPIRLPAGLSAKKLTRQTIEFSLEEQILGDTADEHWVLCQANGSQALSTLVIERKRLRLILDALKQLGREPRLMVWEAHLLPLETDAWTGFMDSTESSGYLRTDDGLAYFFDGTPKQLPALVAIAQDHARSAGKLPSKLQIYSTGSKLLDLAAWTATAGRPCEAVGILDWRSVPLNRAVSLLTEEYAPRSRFDMATVFRPALSLALIGSILLCSVGMIELGWVSYRLRDTRSQMTALLQNTFSGQTTIFDPYRQMRTQLDQLRRARGLVASNDFSALLLEASAVIGTDEKVVRLQYEGGRLEIEFVPNESFNAANAIAAFDRRGLKASVADGQSQNGGASKIMRIGY